MHYVNNELIGALYPTDPNKIIPSWHELLQNSGGGLNATLVHFIIGTMYIALPLLFLVLALWARLKISNAIMAAATQMQTPASEAGKEGGALARDIAIKAIKMIATKGK